MPSKPTSHTPGPWKVEQRIRNVDNAYHQAVMTVEDWVVVDLVNHSQNRHGGDFKANALLIAAAPDLLAALKRICHLHGLSYSVDPAYDPFDAARIAIAKAEGHDA